MAQTVLTTNSSSLDPALISGTTYAKGVVYKAGALVKDNEGHGVTLRNGNSNRTSAGNTLQHESELATWIFEKRAVFKAEVQPANVTSTAYVLPNYADVWELNLTGSNFKATINQHSTAIYRGLPDFTMRVKNAGAGNSLEFNQNQFINAPVLPAYSGSGIDIHNFDFSLDANGKFVYLGLNLNNLATDQELETFKGQVQQLMDNNNAAFQSLIEPVKQGLGGKADAWDTTEYNLPLTVTSTTYAFDPVRPNKSIIATVNTTVNALEPAGGFKSAMGGYYVVKYPTAGITVNFACDSMEGVHVTTPAGAANETRYYFWMIINGKKEFVSESKNVNGTPPPEPIVAKRYFAKGNGTTANIQVAETADTSDAGDFSFQITLRATDGEQVGDIEMLQEKGVGQDGTISAVIAKPTNGSVLQVGVGNSSAYYLRTTESIFDGIIHRAVCTYKRNTTNALLQFFLDGVLEADRDDAPLITPNSSPYSFFTRSTGNYGTKAKIYSWRMWNRVLTPTEITGLESGVIPQNGLVWEMPFTDGTAKDTAKGNNGIVSGGVVFGSETI